MSCADFELELSLFATGALEEPSRSALEAHLAGCSACREALVQSKAAIAAAALPPLSLRDQAQLAQIARVSRPAARQWPIRLAALAAALVAVVLAARTAHPGRHPVRSSSLHSQVARTSPPPTELLPTLAEDAADESVSAEEGEVDPALLAVPSSLDEDSDTALYDAVVFQEADLPYQVDNG